MSKHTLKNTKEQIKTVKDLLHGLADPDCHDLVLPATTRLYNKIVELGVDKVRTENIRRIYGKPELVAYNAFKGLYGIEEILSRIVQEFIAPAARGAEQARKLMVLVGPPGTGKSRLGRGFEKIASKCAPVPVLERCPVKDNPLGLLAELPELAKVKANASDFTAEECLAQILSDLDVAKVLNFSQPEVQRILESTGLQLEGKTADEVHQALAEHALQTIDGEEDLIKIIVFSLGLGRVVYQNVKPVCPRCRDMLRGEFIAPGKPVNPAEFKLDWISFSSAYSGLGGYVRVNEVDKLNFDIRTWFGYKNLGNSARLNPKDPRTVEFNGYFPLANRGVLELVEFLKNPNVSWRALLEATQSKTIPVPEPIKGLVHFDALMFGHSNMKDWADLDADEANAPYKDRFCVFWFGFPTELSEVEKIEKAMYAESDFAKSVEEGGIQVEPTVFMMAAALRILSTLKPDTGGISMLDKLIIYNGDEVRATDKKTVGEQRQRGMGTKITAVDLRQRAPKGETLSGLSARFTADFLAGLAGSLQQEGKTCISSRLWRQRIVDFIKVSITDDDEQKRLIQSVAQEVDTLRRRFVSRILLAAFVPAFRSECQETWDKYRDNIEAFLTNTAPSGVWGMRGGDTAFMHEIESDPVFGVQDSEVKDFRSNIQALVTRYAVQNPGKPIPYDKLNRSLAKCIEAFVLRKVMPATRFLSEKGSKTEEQKKKLNDVMDRLVNVYHFPKEAAEELLDEANTTDGFIILE